MFVKKEKVSRKVKDIGDKFLLDSYKIYRHMSEYLYRCN